MGYPGCDFVGHHLEAGSYALTEDNVAPLRSMAPPDNVSSLRRVLGLFVGSKNFVDGYALRVAPLARLTGKVPWV